MIEPVNKKILISVNDQGPKFIYDFLQQNNFEDIIVHIIHLLLHIHGSYSEIEPQAKQILKNNHITLICKHQV